MLVQDLLREVISSMVINLDVYYVLPVSGGYELRTTNTQYLKPLNVITLEGTEYKITSVDLNKSITVEGTNPIAIGKYQLPNPTYKHGKLKQTSAEITAESQSQRIQYPLIWMFEIAPRTRPQEVDTALQSTGSARLFFMNTSDYSNFTTEDHFKQVINPVNNLVESFLRQLKRHRLVGKVFINNKIAHAKFTNDTGETDSTGNNILPAKLSGIELDLLLPIRKDYTCPVKDIPLPEGGEFDLGFDESFKLN